MSWGGQSSFEISTGRAALSWNNSWDLNRSYITGLAFRTQFSRIQWSAPLNTRSPCPLLTVGMPVAWSSSIRLWAKMHNIPCLLPWLLNKEVPVLSLRSCQPCYGELCQIHLLSTKAIHTSDGGSKSCFFHAVQWNNSFTAAHVHLMRSFTPPIRHKHSCSALTLFYTWSFLSELSHTAGQPDKCVFGSLLLGVWLCQPVYVSSRD